MLKHYVSNNLLSLCKSVFVLCRVSAFVCTVFFGIVVASTPSCFLLAFSFYHITITHLFLYCTISDIFSVLFVSFCSWLLPQHPQHTVSSHPVSKPILFPRSLFTFIICLSSPTFLNTRSFLILSSTFILSILSHLKRFRLSFNFLSQYLRLSSI